MRNLQPNLDATTNIEVPLQSSTRILGLDADNNVIELTITTPPDDGDGSGGMGGGDIDGGGGMGTPVNPAIGTEFCYTLGQNRTNGGDASTSVFIEDINACYEVGNTVIITDPSTNNPTDGNSDTTITTVVTQINPMVDPATNAPAYAGTGADANGITGGSALWYSPFRDYYSWEVVSETSGSGGAAGYGWTWLDWVWEFPNSTGVFDNPNNHMLYGQPGSETTLTPIDDGRDLSSFTAGTILYGRFGGNSSNSDMWNSTANGSTISLNFGTAHGTIVLRKISTLSEHPQPQLWVSTGGFSCYCVYPPFSAPYNSTYGFTSKSTGSIRIGTGTATSIGSWYPTIKADGTRNGIPNLLQPNGIADFTNISSITTHQSRISTGSGNPSQSGPFGWRFTGGTWEYDGNTDNRWENITSTAPTHLNNVSTPYLSQTISDANRTNFLGAVPDSGYYVTPGSTPTLGTFTPAGGAGPQDATGDPVTSQVQICVEVVSVDTLATNYMFPVSANTYDFNPLCPAPDDSDDVSDGDGGLDTRVCEDKQVGQTAGIITNGLTNGTDLSVGNISTIDLDLTGFDDLRILTASTTLTDVEDGSIDITNGDATLTVEYSSAAINGNIITLGGAPTGASNLPATTSLTVTSAGSVGVGQIKFSGGASLVSPSYAGDAFSADLANLFMHFENDTVRDSFNFNTGDQVLVFFDNDNWAVGVIRANQGTSYREWELQPRSLTGLFLGFMGNYGADGSTAQIANLGDLTAEYIPNDGTGFMPLVLSNRTGTWSDPGTARVCLNGSGGDANLGGDLVVGGDETVMGDLCVEGNLKVEGEISTPSGTTTIANGLTVTGDTTLQGTTTFPNGITLNSFGNLDYSNFATINFINGANLSNYSGQSNFDAGNSQSNINISSSISTSVAPGNSFSISGDFQVTNKAFDNVLEVDGNAANFFIDTSILTFANVAGSNGNNAITATLDGDTWFTYGLASTSSVGWTSTINSTDVTITGTSTLTLTFETADAASAGTLLTHLNGLSFWSASFRGGSEITASGDLTVTGNTSLQATTATSFDGPLSIDTVNASTGAATSTANYNIVIVPSGGFTGTRDANTIYLELE